MKNKILFLLLLSISINLYFFSYILKQDPQDFQIADKSQLQDEQFDKTIDEVIDDDTLSVSHFFQLLKQQGDINLFGVMYEQFSSVDDVDSYNAFISEFTSFRILNGALKLKDKSVWLKYWNLFYDKQSGEGVEVGLSKQDFLELLEEFFDKVILGDSIIPTKDNIDFDINVFFSTLELNEALKWCTKLSEVDEYFSNIDSCKDKIYFYRATKQNKYCERITDDYKKTICKDFLEYQK